MSTPRDGRGRFVHHDPHVRFGAGLSGRREPNSEPTVHDHARRPQRQAHGTAEWISSHAERVGWTDLP
jgi:hypothetical protein